MEAISYGPGREVARRQSHIVADLRALAGESWGPLVLAPVEHSGTASVSSQFLKLTTRLLTAEDRLGAR